MPKLNKSVRRRSSLRLSRGKPGAKKRSRKKMRKVVVRGGVGGTKRERDTEPATILNLTKGEYENMEIPEYFKCPITISGMIDPVVASDGYTYEREAIEMYVRGKATPRSPVTRVQFKMESGGDCHLFNNRALRGAIDAYCMMETGKLAPEIKVTAARAPAARAPVARAPAARAPATVIRVSRGVQRQRDLVSTSETLAAAYALAEATGASPEQLRDAHQEAQAAAQAAYIYPFRVRTLSDDEDYEEDEDDDYMTEEPEEPVEEVVVRARRRRRGR
jgi:hypothetical protein